LLVIAYSLGLAQQQQRAKRSFTNKMILLKQIKRMKIFFLILSLFVFLNGHSQSNKAVEFVEINHGMVKVSRERTEIQINSPTGSRGILESFEFIKITDSVPAILKNNFGIEYMLKTADSTEIDVTIEWLYPEKITNTEGKKFKTIKYTTQRYTNEPTFSSYSLDEPYELVKGKWKMNIYAYEKLLYSKTFILY
jgi:Domain of unknown function (DUF3859)